MIRSRIRPTSAPSATPTRHRLGAAVAAIVVAAFAAAGVQAVSVTAAGAVGAYDCASDVVYGLNTTGEILAIDPATGTTVAAGDFTSATAPVNALAISLDGTSAYAVALDGITTIHRYDALTGTSTAIGTIPEVGGTPYMGAINPANGLYYVGYQSGAVYQFYAFDPVTNTSHGLQFTLTAPPVGGNGDLAFDASGRAYVVMSGGGGSAANNQLVVVEPPLPSDGSAATGQLLTNPAPYNRTFQGIAISSTGYLYTQYTASSSRVLAQNDPNTGAVVASHTILNPDGTNNASMTDLSSCVAPSSLTLVKDIDGRASASDQFALTISGGGVSQNTSGLTSGSTTGPQTDLGAVAGPIVAVPGRTYTITESAASGADLANYSTEWECIDRSDGDAVVASGTGPSGSLLVPAAVGSDLLCTFTNSPEPSYEVSKSAESASSSSGQAVPDEEVTYTIVVTNTSGHAFAGTDLASISDDLGDVLDDAALIPGSVTATAGTVDVTGTSLTWSGPLAADGSPGDQVTITYRVKVGAAPGAGAELTNVVVPTGPGGSCPDPDACTTTTVVLPADPGVPMVAPALLAIAVAGGGAVIRRRRA